MRYALGIDIGGSSARVALVREDGVILASASQPTGFDTDRATLLGRFGRAIEEVLAPAREQRLAPLGAGVGMPGFKDEQGCVDSASNLPSLNGVNLAGEISRISGLPAAMENDMNMLALGEYHFGGHAVPGNLLVVAIGTGVGAALLQGGRLLRVTHGCLGDPGHVLVSNGGRLCRCGARGCLEAHAAGWALVEMAEEAGLAAGALRPTDIFTAAREGSTTARAVLERAAEALAMGLASFCALYQPQRIVLGGNVLLEGQDLLLPRTVEKFLCIAQPHALRQLGDAGPPFSLSTIPQTAGVLGGAALMLYNT